MRIDYWDYIGWKDTLAMRLQRATEGLFDDARGRIAMSTRLKWSSPALNVIGSDSAGIESAIGATRKGPMA